MRTRIRDPGKARLSVIDGSPSVRSCPMRKRRPAKKPVPLPVRAARVLRRLRHVRGLSEAEKSVHALGLAATPQERWDLWEQQMRGAGFWKPLKTKASGT